MWAKNPKHAGRLNLACGMPVCSFLVWMALVSFYALNKEDFLVSCVFLTVSQAPLLQVWQAANTDHTLPLHTPLHGVAHGAGQYPCHWAAF